MCKSVFCLVRDEILAFNGLGWTKTLRLSSKLEAQWQINPNLFLFTVLPEARALFVLLNIPFFFFLDELEILFKEKTNYTGKQASPWIIETKVRGLLPTSKESKNLKAKDYFVREWGAILHNLGTQQTETLEEDAKRIQESSQMDLILRARGGGSFQIRKEIGTNLNIPNDVSLPRTWCILLHINLSGLGTIYLIF